MKEVLLNVVYVLITTVLIPLFAFAINKLIKRIDEKTKNEKLSTYLKNMSDLVLTTVKAISQTYVNELKKADSFDLEAQKIAFEKVKDTVVGNISVDVQKFLTENHFDFEAWLEIAIESAVHSIKN